MVLSRRAAPFDHPDWLFELKHDGFRAVAYVADGECRLVSRRNHQHKSFAPLRAAIAGELRVTDAILDGEIACLDAGFLSFRDCDSSRHDGIIPTCFFPSLRFYDEVAAGQNREFGRCIR